MYGSLESFEFLCIIWSQKVRELAEFYPNDFRAQICLDLMQLDNHIDDMRKENIASNA
jgi:hypothetical protein